MMRSILLAAVAVAGLYAAATPASAAPNFVCEATDYACMEQLTGRPALPQPCAGMDPLDLAVEFNRRHTIGLDGQWMLVSKVIGLHWTYVKIPMLEYLPPVRLCKGTMLMMNEHADPVGAMPTLFTRDANGDIRYFPVQP